MSIDFQTLHDALVAIITAVGVAVAISIAFIAVGAFAERGKARVGKLAVSRDVVAPAQHPTQTDNARDLVLR
jgi:hypothetical protein